MNKTLSKERFFSIIIVLSSIVIGFTIADYAAGWYRKSIENSSKLDEGLLQYDSDLGWKLTPNWSGKHIHHDFEVNYSVGSDATRKQSVNRVSKPHKVVGVLGDSFTFGFGVNDDETFTSRLSQDNPEKQFINFGVPGFSTDQEYLLMRKHGKFAGVNEYWLVVYLVNDILDNALSHPLQAEPSKPYFVIDKGRLTLKNTPVPKVRKTPAMRRQNLRSIVFGDYRCEEGKGKVIEWLKSKSELLNLIMPSQVVCPVNVEQELDRNLKIQKELFSAILSKIRSEASSQGAELSLILLPGRSYLAAVGSYSYIFQEYVRKFIAKEATRQQIKTLDIALEMRKEQVNHDLFYPFEGHLTAKGHRWVASRLRNL